VEITRRHLAAFVVLHRNNYVIVRGPGLDHRSTDPLYRAISGT
jgi:hypothetical protein